MSCCQKVGSVRWAAHGASGVVKAALGVDMAPKHVLEARRSVCRACPDRTSSGNPKFAKTKGMTSLSFCKICKCNIAAKTSILAEKCCADKW